MDNYFTGNRYGQSVDPDISKKELQAVERVKQFYQSVKMQELSAKSKMLKEIEEKIEETSNYPGTTILHSWAMDTAKRYLIARGKKDIGVHLQQTIDGITGYDDFKVLCRGLADKILFHAKSKVNENVKMYKLFIKRAEKEGSERDRKRAEILKGDVEWIKQRIYKRKIKPSSD